MKYIILSILENGKYSPCIEDFVNICHKISIASFNISKYRNYILEKSGLSIEDFAFDAIADLFKETDGKYFYFKNFFMGVSESTPEEFFKAKLNSLIISRTNQRITEVRENFGEIYFKVKRAIHLHINRHNNKFKNFTFRENEYIYTCENDAIDFDKLMMPDCVILERLYLKVHKKLSVTKIVDTVFENLNNQNDYCKALININLFSVVSKFYKTRLSDFLLKSDNVHYYLNEEEI